MNALLSRFCLALTLATSLGTALHAATVTYSSASSFAAATTGVTTYTFPTVFVSSSTQTYSIGPLNFQQGVSGAPDGSYYTTYNDGLYGNNQSYLELTNTTSSPEVENILLSTPATALGFQIGGDGASYAVAVNGSTVGLFTTPSSSTVPLASSFFGVTSTTPINSISFTTTAIDTDTLFVQVGSLASTTAVTPEPSTFALLGTGLLGAMGMVRRRLR